MGTHADKAVKLFEEGCSCSQAVFTAYAEDFGIDRETAMKVSVALGAGVGHMRETCGAVTGMALVAGLKYGNTDPADAEAKSKALEAAKALAEKFKAENYEEKSLKAKGVRVAAKEVQDIVVQE